MSADDTTAKKHTADEAEAETTEAGATTAAAATPSKKSKLPTTLAELEADAGAEVLVKLTEGVWSWVSPFTFVYGEWTIPMFNRGVLVHIPSKNALAILNPSELKGDVEKHIHDVEAATGATVQYLVSPGDWHWVFIEAHLKAFPHAKAYLAPGRVPSKAPAFEYTILEYENKTTVLDELAPDLIVVPFQGCINTEDGDGGARHEFIFYIKAAKAVANADSFFYHAPGTGALTDMLKSFGFHEGLIEWHFNGAKVIGDYDKVKATLETVLAWDFDTYISLHGPPGNIKVDGAKADLTKLFEWVKQTEAEKKTESA